MNIVLRVEIFLGNTRFQRHVRLQKRLWLGWPVLSGVLDAIEHLPNALIAHGLKESDSSLLLSIQQGVDVG
jgi:hypothetical protein